MRWHGSTWGGQRGGSLDGCGATAAWANVVRRPPRRMRCSGSLDGCGATAASTDAVQRSPRRVRRDGRLDGCGAAAAWTGAARRSPRRVRRDGRLDGCGAAVASTNAARRWAGVEPGLIRASSDGRMRAGVTQRKQLPRPPEPERCESRSRRPRGRRHPTTRDQAPPRGFPQGGAEVWRQGCWCG